MPSRALQTSWLAGILTEQELQEAWLVFQATATATALPESIASRVGPHIVRADDPRIAYQQEELHLLNIWQDAAHRMADNIISMNWLLHDLNKRTMQLAAADTTTVFQPRQWTLEEGGITIDIQPDYESEQCLVIIFDAQGEVSSQLDEYIIRIPETEVYVKICAGLATIPMRQLLRGLALSDADGNPVTVKIKRN